MKGDARQDESIAGRRGPGVTRRKVLLAGGSTLLAMTFMNDALDTALGQENNRQPSQRPNTPPAGAGQDMRRPGIRAQGETNPPFKPVFLPEQGVTDPVTLSLAETIFWLDQDMEHAKFFVMLMPPEELSGPRTRAQQFMTSLADHLQRARTASIDRSNYVAFNQQTIDLVRPFVDYKREMREAQASGKLNSLVWPLFFEHVAREGEHLIERLTRLNRNNIEIERNDLVDFFARIMDEHAQFIAHLLDPTHDTLINKAERTSADFKRLRDRKPKRKGGDDPVMGAVKDIIAFKTTAEKGIIGGLIKSIIHPTLADHVRREAVKFEDDLRRAV